MRRPRVNLRYIGQAAVPAVGLLLIAYFVGSALVGQNGIFSLGDYQRLRAQREQELKAAEAQRDHLQQRAHLLNPKRVDPDLADELVRRRTDQVREDEVILKLP